jgi:hypothetical protein
MSRMVKVRFLTEDFLILKPCKRPAYEFPHHPNLEANSWQGVRP